jgi:zinc transport system substrate-binding protein
MRKRLIIVSFTIVVLVVILVSGCNRNAANNLQETAKGGKIVVYASIYPMYDFVRNIGKDRIDLRLVVPPGAEPHEWEPTAKFMAELEKADVFIYNGAGMELWVDKVLGSVSNKGLIIVEASRGIELIELEGHQEEHEDEKEEEHRHGKLDPHVWLNPLNAIIQAESIKGALIKADKANEDFYEANYKDFKEKLLQLDKIYEQKLTGLKRKEIVVAHAAFGYLAQRYGLKQISIAGLSPQEEPSAAKMAEIVEFSRKHDVKYIFFETLTSPRLAEVLAREVGAGTAVLNPIGGLTTEEIKDGKDYITIMEENLKVLQKALGE